MIFFFSPMVIVSVINIIRNLLAPLTDEEVAAIDAAGAKGPIMTLHSMKRLARMKWMITDYLAIVTLLVLLLMFGYYHWVDNMQRFAI